MRYRCSIVFIVVCLTVMFIFNLPAFSQNHMGTAEFLLEMGKEYYKQGDYQRALVEFNKVILIEPENRRASLYVQIIEEKMALEEEGLSRQEAVKRALGKTKEPTEKLGKKPAEEPADEAGRAVSSGGAWGAPKGHCLLELYLKYYWHNSHFDNDGNEMEWEFGGAYKEMLTELKIEYGLYDKFTLVGYFPYKYACWKDDFAKQTTSGMADIRVGGKYRFFEEPIVTAVQLRGKFPGGYDKNAIPALGAGQIDLEIMLLGEKSFDPLPCYLKGELGYRVRFEDPNDELPYFFEFGYKPIDKLTLKIGLDGMEGLNGTGKIDDEDYTKGAVGLIYNLRQGTGPADSLDLELGYGRTFAGKNTGAASEITFKVNCGFPLSLRPH
ncbi:MAG: transporter [Candidatus Omnitrophota bacterium]|nr:transporter [Candidatus Omnitrophota bacterium]